jgi:signal peptidase I
VGIAIALAFVIQAAVAKPYEIPTESMVPTIQANDRIIANRVIYRFRDIDHGDIVVFDPTRDAKRSCGETQGGNIPFVKRVIGLPGDAVEVRRQTVTATQAPVMARIRSGIDDGGPRPTDVRIDTVRLQPGDRYAVTYINGAPFVVKEAVTPVDLQAPPRAYGLAGRTIMSDLIYGFPSMRVPPGNVFVLGDNRPDSCDSHQWEDRTGRPAPFVPIGNVIGQAEVIYWPLKHMTFLD